MDALVPLPACHEVPRKTLGGGGVYTSHNLHGRLFPLSTTGCHVRGAGGCFLHPREGTHRRESGDGPWQTSWGGVPHIDADLACQKAHPGLSVCQDERKTGWQLVRTETNSKENRWINRDGNDCYGPLGGFFPLRGHG